jgi:2,5-diamino-6-(ribosylamino)-4(3H)-pyrimidinone 5'-phosphate reductase
LTIYDDLAFPPAPPDRPYTFINMVATIDGKTVIGDRGDSVVGLGSKLDQQLMDKIESASDAVLIGGQTLRATSKNWSPKTTIRIGVTRSGNVPFDSQFFADPVSQAYLACPFNLIIDVPDHVQRISAGKDQVDPVWLARYLRHDLGVERLHILGGSETNAQFLSKDLVDELFLTMAPKMKLGRSLPTYAGGDPLPKDELQNYELVEHHVVESEVFLRYRRNRK